MIIIKIKPLILSIALLFSTPAWTDEEKDRKEMLQMSEDFAKCSAVFKVMQLTSEQSGKSFLAKQDKQIANGAMIASATLATMMGRKFALERTESIIDTEFTMWMELLENNPEELVKQYKPKYENCINNLPVQETILKMAREKVYD